MIENNSLKIFSLLNLIRNGNESLLKNEELLIKEINQIFSDIKNVQSLEAAKECFELLEKVQIELAKLLFKENIQFSTSLRKFVKDFDRLDDVEMRMYLFKNIKEDNYSV